MIISRVKWELVPSPRGTITANDGRRYNKKWLGPGHISGTDKALARVSWDRMRKTTQL